MIKKNVIAKFESGYILAVHPNPTCLDVLCLFNSEKFSDHKIDMNKPIKESGHKIEGQLEYADFGLIDRIKPPSNFPPEKIGLVEKFYNETAEKFSNL